MIETDAEKHLERRSKPNDVAMREIGSENHFQNARAQYYAYVLFVLHPRFHAFCAKTADV